MMNYRKTESDELAELFKYFANPTRVRILMLLNDGDRCVYDIAESLEMSQSAVSHQLSLLRKSNLVRTEREGKSVLYALNDEHVWEIIRCGKEHMDKCVRGESLTK